jgi:hypothetical protein
MLNYKEKYPNTDNDPAAREGIMSVGHAIAVPHGRAMAHLTGTFGAIIVLAPLAAVVWLWLQGSPIPIHFGLLLLLLPVGAILMAISLRHLRAVSVWDRQATTVPLPGPLSRNPRQRRFV